MARIETSGIVLREPYRGWCSGTGWAGLVLGCTHNAVAVCAHTGDLDLPALNVADNAQHEQTRASGTAFG